MIPLCFGKSKRWHPWLLPGYGRPITCGSTAISTMPPRMAQASRAPLAESGRAGRDTLMRENVATERRRVSHLLMVNPAAATKSRSSTWA